MALLGTGAISTQFCFTTISASLSINIVSVSAHGIELSSVHLSVGLCVGLSVGRCVREVYCGKMADWSWMPFGMASGVGRGTRASCDRQRRRGSFGEEFGGVQLKPMETLLRSCVRATRCSKITWGGLVR